MITLALLGAAGGQSTPTVTPRAESESAPAPVTESEGGIAPSVHRAFVVGDSLAVGAQPYLEADLPGWRIEQSAFTGRHTDDGVSELAGRAGSLPPVIVVSLGTNDDPSATSTFDRQVRTVLGAAGPNRCVIWPNIVRPPYNGVSYAGYNRVLSREESLHPNLIVIDWVGMASQHPEWFGSDGVHPSPSGYAARARVIAQAVNYCA